MIDDLGNPLPRNTLNEIRSKIHDGRTINHSVCDVIDNSIDAEATKIDVWLDKQPEWQHDDEKKEFLMFVDNGKGIEKKDLKHIIEFNAERTGGYALHELGSFGLGLKDALLAHGEEITVFSKLNGSEAAMVRLSMQLSREREDWIYVNHEELVVLVESWGTDKKRLEKWNTPVFNNAYQKIKTMDSGTIIILEFSHRPIELEFDEDSEDELERITVLSSLKEWIAMTFADYLTGINIGNRTKDNPLEISVNGDPIYPLDPFMKSEIGKGDFDGQQGTLVARWPFQYSGLECVFNQYILPNKQERNSRCQGHDNRMKKATKHQIVNLQGIYIKRNGRILDGPWNGMWRREGMAMSTSHHTVARWELVLPPEAVYLPELVPPDKSRVSLTGMLKDILKANKYKRIWHLQDELPYGSAPAFDQMQYNKRARARNSSKDLIKTCAEEGCSKRVLDEEYCIDHTVNRCIVCAGILEEGDNCTVCSDTICIEDDCIRVRNEGIERCIVCSQPVCIIEGCTSLQEIMGNLCATHASQKCNFPGGCESLSITGLSRCQEHLKLDFGQLKIILSTEGPLFKIDDGHITTNVNHEDFSKYLQFIQNVR